MNWSFMFFFNSLLLGVGLAMDAFSVSLANGLNEPLMKRKKTFAIASVFGVFQGLMPFLGWVCIKTVVNVFSSFEKFIPWIALALLAFIGTKMLIDGLKHREEQERPAIGFWGLMVQGLATSIDALSVGFTIAEYGVWMAVVASLLIACVTFGICLAGVFIGKKFGNKLAGKASIFGGILLILIGVEIFLTGILG